MYEVILSQSAEKKLSKLDSGLQERITAVLERCRILPHRHAKSIVGSPFYSIRCGDYRIIVDIVEGQLQILVIEIGHRKNIYDK